MSIEFLIDAVAVLLTLLVLSRVIGDSPLFRIAQYLFIGVSLGFAFVVVYHQVLMPALEQILSQGSDPFVLIQSIIPFLLGILLLPRIIGQRYLSWVANIPLSLLFGVSAAAAFSGALVGTLLPQVFDTVAITTHGPGPELAGAVLLAIGVILVLSYFYFTVPTKAGLMRISAVSAQTGRWLLMVSFGFFLAGALLTYLAALTQRLIFIVSWGKGLL